MCFTDLLPSYYWTVVVSPIVGELDYGNYGEGSQYGLEDIRSPYR